MVNRVNRKTGSGKKARSGFKYHQRSAESVKQRANRDVGSTFDSILKQGVDKFTAKNGSNCIRILPPTWEDKEHFGLEVHVHKYVGATNGSYLCLKKMKGKPCPICEASEEAANAGDRDEAKDLREKEDYIYWILDRNGEDEFVPQVWQQSAFADRDIVVLTQSSSKRSTGTLAIDHPEEGFDLTFRRGQLNKKDPKTTRYSAWAFDRESSPICDDPKQMDEILDFISENPLPSVLKYYTYEYLEKIISGEAEEKDEELDDDENEEKGFKHRKRGGEEAEGEDEEIAAHKSRRRRQEDDEDEEPEDNDDETSEDEDDEEDNHRVTRKTGKTSKRRADPDESEDEELEEDDDEPKTRKKPAKRTSRRNNDEEDEGDRRTARKPAKARRASEDDEDDDEDERPVRRTSSKKPKPSRRRDEDDEDEDED